jgi:hypothetical protein
MESIEIRATAPSFAIFNLGRRIYKQISFLNILMNPAVGIKEVNSSTEA